MFPSLFFINFSLRLCRHPLLDKNKEKRTLDNYSLSLRITLIKKQVEEMVVTEEKIKIKKKNKKNKCPERKHKINIQTPNLNLRQLINLPDTFTTIYLSYDYYLI